MEALWLLHVDLLIQVSIREGGCDVHRTKFKVFNCGHGHNDAECGRTEGRCKAFIVVESWTLRVSLCDDSGLEALNGTICIVFDPEYPSRSYGFLVHRQVHDIEGASLNKGVVLKCGGFSPSICMVPMHSLSEGVRF